MASGEAEQLNYTTTTLRVSIHCKTCIVEVKKVLRRIEGVYKVTVDAAQHKVTVVGDVQADALLLRLRKAGKPAALWPSPAHIEAENPEEAAAQTTTAPQVSTTIVRSNGCVGRVKKMLRSIEGVCKVTVDAAQHRVTVIGDALLLLLRKAGKPPVLWPLPESMEAMMPMKPEEAAPAALPLPAGESSAQDAVDAKPKEKPPENGIGKEKPAKDKKAHETSKDDDAQEIAGPKEKKGKGYLQPVKQDHAERIGEPKKKKGSPLPAKQDAAEEAGMGEPSGGNKGKKKKNTKPMEGGEEEEAPAPVGPTMVSVPENNKPPQQPPSSVSAELLYGPPGMRLPPPQELAGFLYGMQSSPPQESYHHVFNDDNISSCSLM